MGSAAHHDAVLSRVFAITLQQNLARAGSVPPVLFLSELAQVLFPENSPWPVSYTCRPISHALPGSLILSDILT